MPCPHVLPQLPQSLGELWRLMHETTLPPSAEHAFGSTLLVQGQFPPSHPAPAQVPLRG